MSTVGVMAASKIYINQLYLSESCCVGQCYFLWKEREAVRFRHCRPNLGLQVAFSRLKDADRSTRKRSESRVRSPWL